jgi:hypothetical protein
MGRRVEVEVTYTRWRALIARRQREQEQKQKRRTPHRGSRKRIGGLPAPFGEITQ